MLNKLLGLVVVATAHKNNLLEKLKSNLQEVKARGGQMIVFEEEESDTGPMVFEKQQRHGVSLESEFKVVKTTKNAGRIAALIRFNIPLQLLSYHVVLIKGTDVDQPRNLAKSVTVE